MCRRRADERERTVGHSGTELGRRRRRGQQREREHDGERRTLEAAHRSRAERMASRKASRVGAAAAAADAFDRVRKTNTYLDSALTRRDNHAHNLMSETFSLLKSKVRSNTEFNGLNRAFKELEDVWGVLMLLPNGPYEYELRRLVEELEPGAGAGDLSADNSQLLELVRFLKVRLGSNLRANRSSGASATIEPSQPNSRGARQPRVRWYSRSAHDANSDSGRNGSCRVVGHMG